MPKKEFLILNAVSDAVILRLMLFCTVFYAALCGAAKAAVAHPLRSIIYSDAVLLKDTLRKSAALCYLQRFFLIGGIGQLNKHMSLVVRVKIIAVNDAHRII